MELVFIIIIFLYSVIAHEVAHGKMAEYLGDPTARYMGRLTLNPIPHLDPIGSILLPLLLVVTNSPILFGWAKPVPYNPYNLRNQHYGNAMVAGAGVGTNLALAIGVGLIMRLLPLEGAILEILAYVVRINLILGIFNLVPIPPLDGSKVLFDFFPHTDLIIFLERYGFFLLILFLLFGLPYLFPIINFLFKFIIGVY